MTMAGLWGYGDWRHLATGCTALVSLKMTFWTSQDILATAYRWCGQIYI